MAFTGVSVVHGGNVVGHVTNASTTSGYHLLVVNDYRRSKATAPNGTMIGSLPFMVGGHRWCINYHPNGVDQESADHISLFLRRHVDKYASTADDPKVQLEFSFVDQFERQTPRYLRATEPNNFTSLTCLGYPKFVTRDSLENSNHLKGDSFIIRCDMAIVTTADLFIRVPPSRIRRHIRDLLQSKEGTDVTFKVGCRTFAAHRCVLASRSAVFKAELYGPMKEGTTASVIHIEEMEANVFRALLDFIYTDLLPNMEMDKQMEEEGQTQESSWLQDLLAAADRYDLQRLKSLCERRLCKHIDARSVAAILTLAERHNSRGLKKVCLEFLDSPDNMKEVMAIDGLDYISTTCPSLFKEITTRFVS